MTAVQTEQQLPLEGCVLVSLKKLLVLPLSALYLNPLLHSLSLSHVFLASSSAVGEKGTEINWKLCVFSIFLDHYVYTFQG